MDPKTIAGAVVLFLLVEVAAAHAGITYQSQSRQVDVTIVHPIGDESDLDQAVGFGPFDGSAEASYASPSGEGIATASQQSWLGPNGFGVSGATGILNPFFTQELAFYQARAIFDVSFLLDAESSFSLFA
jgi:hypothetical protein